MPSSAEKHSRIRLGGIASLPAPRGGRYAGQEGGDAAKSSPLEHPCPALTRGWWGLLDGGWSDGQRGGCCARGMESKRTELHQNRQRREKKDATTATLSLPAAD